MFLQVLLVRNEKGFCGGVIYKPTWILTASHCLENIKAQHLKVVAGMDCFYLEKSQYSCCVLKSELFQPFLNVPR